MAEKNHTDFPDRWDKQQKPSYMRMSDKGLAILKHYEGCELEAYKCPAGIWTIGYGNTFFPDGKPVRQGDKVTKAEAEAMLPAILRTFEISVHNHMVVPVKQHEFDAMVSLAYNIGIGAFENSTLLRKFKAQAPSSEVAEQFHRWNKGGGKVLNGLVKRRAAEAYLYEHGEVKIF